MRAIIHHAQPFFIMCVAGILFFQYSCRHANITTSNIDPLLKSEFSFKPGSYWIYRDAITNRTDSFVVTSNKDHYIDLNNNTREEQISVDIAQYNIFPHDSDSLCNLLIYLRHKSQLQLIYSSEQNDIYKIYNYAPLMFPFTTGNFISATTPLDTINITIPGIMNVNGYAFNEVAVINIYDTYSRSIDFQFNDTFYVSNAIGLIKINMHHFVEGTSKHWEIVRWKLVK